MGRSSERGYTTKRGKTKIANTEENTEREERVIAYLLNFILDFVLIAHAFFVCVRVYTLACVGARSSS